MRFVLQMAWRDSKASRRRLLLFSLCVVFGIAALVALDSFTVSLARTIAAESKTLLGADLVASSRSPFPAGLEPAARRAGAELAEETSFSSMMLFGRAPGGAVERTRLVQVRAEEGSYPFYGDIVTQPASAVATLRAAEGSGARVVILEATLLAQYGLRVGDSVRLGSASFQVAGALEKISGESLAVTLLAPRALVPQRALAGAGLDENGPLVRHRLALKLPPGADAEALARDLRDRFASARLSFETVEGRRRELGRAMTNVDGFLSLAGFIALLLGAIGVASAVHAHVKRKVATVAVLRCVGVSARQAFAIYLMQGCAIGAVGSVAGSLLGLAVQAALPRVLAGLLPVPVVFQLSLAGVLRGMLAGFAICVLFTLLPLLGLRDVPPLAALRALASEERPPARSKLRAALCLAIFAAVAGFAVWQTRSLRTGLGFAAAVGAAFGIFLGAARLMAGLARRWAGGRFPYVVRQGLANLHRPQNRTALLLVALGLGTFLFFTLFLARTAFLRQLEIAGAGDRPNLMFFDVQEDQVGPLNAYLAAQGVGRREEASVVTMKIAALRGRSVEDLLRDDRGSRLPSWTLRREYRSTVRDHLSATEKVVAGHFVGRVQPAADPAGALAPISVDEGLADDMHLKLGDEIDWDVQGVPIRTEVGSIRSVDWRRLAPNFFVVFPAGVVDDAPKFYVVAVRAASPDASAALQGGAVAKFPNITAIDLSSILQTLDGIFAKVGFVVEFMALFTAATAVLVLACAILASRHQRRREAVLLRTLGASSRQLAGIQASEYAALGAMAAGIGCLLAWAAAGALDHWVFDLPTAAPGWSFAAAAGAVIAVTLGTGWLADRAVPSAPPLETLRAEE